MVRIFIALVLVLSLELFANDAYGREEPSEAALMQKIESFLDAGSFVRNKEFIKIIFDPYTHYYKLQRIDTLKVVQTLKDNGLLKLVFNSPQELVLHFKTNGSPLFFVKVMSDTLRNIGYYRYVTQASQLNAEEFSWSITLKSEYATDPVILQQELQKSGCSIMDIEKNSQYEWSYSIDMSRAYLNVTQLQPREKLTLKRSLYSYWLDVSKIEELEIHSSARNQWYPSIAYYDASMHLLKIIQENEVYKYMNLEMPQEAKYIKITDLYTLKNVKDELVLHPKGAK